MICGVTMKGLYGSHLVCSLDPHFGDHHMTDNGTTFSPLRPPDAPGIANLSEGIAGISVAHPGDTVIVVLRDRWDPETFERLSEALVAAMPDSVRWVIFDNADVVIAKGPNSPV